MRKEIISERLQSVIIAVLFIAVFLPFGLSHFGWLRWPLLAGIALIIAFSVLTSEMAVDKLLGMPNDINRGSRYIIRRNIWFETLNIMLSVTLMTAFLHCFVNDDVVDNHFSWTTVGSVFAVNCYTTFIIHLYWRNVYKKRYLIRQLEEAQLLNGMLQERHRRAEESKPAEEPQPAAKEVTIVGQTRESLTIRPDDFVYATSEGNYVRVHYIYNKIEPKEMMIRTSMKNAVDTLCGYVGIMQCHRAFIVNLRHVEKIDGRNSGMSLVMRPTGDTVLVSRQYAADVKSRIKDAS